MNQLSCCNYYCCYCSADSDDCPVCYSADSAVPVSDSGSDYSCSFFSPPLKLKSEFAPLLGTYCYCTSNNRIYA